MNAMNELIEAHENGTLNRKQHWRPFQRAVKSARKSKLPDDKIKILDSIDKIFFNAWTVPKLKVILGTIILFLGTIILELIFWYLLPLVQNIYIALVLYAVFSIFNLILSHSPFHFVVGRALGIKFRNYFIFSSSFRKSRLVPSSIVKKIPLIGIKFEMKSFLEAKRWKRTLMFISSPLLTFIWFIINYLILILYYPLNNSIIQLVGFITIIAFIVSLVASFTSYGDLWKAKQDY